MTFRIEFPAPGKRVSMNDRSHWARKANLTKLWRSATYWAVFKAWGNTRKGCAKPPSFVRVTFPVRDNRRRDADNPAPTVKAIVDGLVDAGIWPDDTPEYVETLGSRFAKGAEMVVVEIIPRKEIAA